MSFSVSHNPTAVPVSPLDISNFSNTLECPVIATPLTDAVMLIPCGHTISEIAANNIYHGMRNVNGSETTENQDPCPLCRRKVTAYYPNQIMRSLVRIALGVKLEEALPLVSATVSADEEKNLDAIPFPGLGAKFVLTRGNWNIFDSGCELVRELRFASQTQESLFEEMAVFGYKDGHVAISLSFRKNLEIVRDYLSECGINLDFSGCNVGYYISNLSNTKLLFRILAKHNDIPADKFSLIRDLVTSGNWNNVTPLAADEHLPVTPLSHLTWF